MDTAFSPSLQALIPRLEELPLPVLLAGGDFAVLWQSPFLRRELPFFAQRDSLQAFLAGYDLARLREQLVRERRALSCPSRVPFSSGCAELSPVLGEDGELEGVLVYLGRMQPDAAPQDGPAADQMLASFNYSLRDPLNRLFLLLSSTARSLAAQRYEESRQGLDEIASQCYQMLRSCVSITEYARYCSGSSRLDLQPTEMLGFLRELLFNAALYAREAGVQLEYELAEGELWMPVDRDKLVILLTSILSNSIAFRDPDRPEGCQVRVTASCDGRRLQVQVADNGRGMEPEVSSRAFEPYFSQGPDGSPYWGCGLGLSLGRMITAQHGGSLLVQSHPDAGTTVTFTLPLQQPDAPIPPQLQDAPAREGASRYLRNPYSLFYVFLANAVGSPELD